MQTGWGVLIVFFLLITSSVQAQQTRGVGVDARKTPVEMQEGTYRALLIGNDIYESTQWPDLKTAVRDVEELGKVLQLRYGFKAKNIILRTNVDRDELLNAFYELQDVSREEDNVLIYYAGHGESNKRGGFWIPVRTDKVTSWIGNETILERLKNITAKHKFLISDSCFSGNLLTRSRVEDFSESYRFRRGYFMEKTALTSVQGLSSGGNTPVADGCDYCKSHSLFAYHLLELLNANQNRYLSASEMGVQLTKRVSNDTFSLYGKSQSPIHSPIASQGHTGGEFFFVPVDLGKINISKTGIYLIREEVENHPSGFDAVQAVLKGKLTREIKNHFLKVGLTKVVDRSQLEATIKQDLSVGIVKSAIVVTISGSRKKEITMMYQGKSEMGLKLKAYGLHEGKLVVLAEDTEIKPQVWLIRRWKESPDQIEKGYVKTADKLTKKWSQVSLSRFFAHLEE